MLGDQAEGLQGDEEEHEDDVGVGEEPLPGHIPPQVEQQPDARAEGKGNVDLGQEGGVAGRQSGEALLSADILRGLNLVSQVRILNAKDK